MGYTNLILVILMAAIAGVMTAGMGVNNNEADAVVSDFQQDQQARETAMSGLNLAINKLKTHEDWSNTSGMDVQETGYQNGAYVANFTDYTAPESPDGESVKVTVRGYNGASEHVVVAKFEKDRGLQLPKVFENVVTGPDVIVSGNPGFWSWDENVNVNIHANDDLTVTSTEIIIGGYGSYSDTFTGDESVFQPVDTNQGNDPVFSTSSIDMDYFTSNALWQLQSQADHVTQGSLVWEGDMTIDLTNFEGVTGAGTLANPYVLYVNGSLTIDGNITILGYATIVTQWGIEVRSGSTVIAANTMPPINGTQAEMRAWIAQNLPDGTPISFLACGDIIVEDDVTITGQLYALYDAEIEDPAPGEMVCPEPDMEAPLDSYVDPNNSNKRIICHIPPGNPDNRHTISISRNAVQTHYDHHGDYAGPCVDMTECEYQGGSTIIIGEIISQESHVEITGSVNVWYTPPTETVIPQSWLETSEENDGGVKLVDISEWSRDHITPEQLALMSNNDLQGSVEDPHIPGNVLICHVPPGNTGPAHTISVPYAQLHLYYGFASDYDGACGGQSGGY